MRRLLASLFAAAVLTVPMAATPAPTMAQAGLVNVEIDDVEVLKNVNVAAAVPVIVQACDLIDATNTSVIVGLLSAVASGQSSQEVEDCDQEGDQGIVITQAASPQERGGRPGGR